MAHRYGDAPLRQSLGSSSGSPAETPIASVTRQGRWDKGIRHLNTAVKVKQIRALVSQQ